MKKRVMVLLALFAFIYALPGCSGNKDVPAERSSQMQQPQTVEAEETQLEAAGDVVEIKEKMFITQINDIYLNADEYLNKKIKLEGFYSVYEVEGKAVHSVIRNGPGCCGNDGVAGFEFVWDGEYPQENAWLRVVGTLEIKEEEGMEYMYLDAMEVEVLEERGAEFVEN